MRLRIIAAGKLRGSPLREVVDDYVGRLKHYLPIDEVEVPRGRGPKALRAIERAIPPKWELWALDPGGKQPRSAELARWIEHRMNQGTRGIACIIGDADGIPRQIIEKADLRLSLSRLTLPHRLARAVLAEQLYRSMTIIRGQPYDK